MTSDGERLCAANKSGIAIFDPKTLTGIRIAWTRYPLRCVAQADGEFYVVEQPFFGHDKHHRYVRIYPETYEVYALRYDAAEDVPRK